MRNNEISSYLENIALLLFGVFLLAFPLAFTDLTTDLFALPKQILLAVITLVALLLFGARLIADAKVKIQRTPFDLSIALFGLFALISTLLAVNRWDSLIAYVSLLFALVLFYLIVNFVKSQSSVLFLIASLVIGASLLSISSVLTFFKIYILPFEFAKNQTFTPLGSLLDQALYLSLVLPIALYYALPLLKIKELKDFSVSTIGFFLSFLVIAAGLGLTIYELFILQKPLILPLETGFQTAFAAISQDTGRIAQGFFFGSGFGTYLTDFTRFKQITYNLNPILWSFAFFRSSSFVLELLATVGILGIGAFGFLLVKVLGVIGESRKNPVLISLLLAFALSFLLPFSFIGQTLLFVLLALFAAAAGLNESKKFFEVELYFVAFKKGIIPLSTSSSQSEANVTRLLPVSFFILFIAIGGFLGFYSYRFAASDVLFRRSLVSLSKNEGLPTYNSQVSAINLFPNKDSYQRIYSQTNLALANSLASSVPQGSSPSAQIQQTITTLIQQSITAGRRATLISPQTTLNWQNLSSIYRSLIGFGQNAEVFSIQMSNQATLLDPNNPQRYLDTGGLFYQLGQWENAQRQFQIAVNLKPDFANAYYNLGHALEQKGDLQNALAQYQTVRNLLANANDKENLKRISDEIEALQTKIGTAPTPSAGSGQAGTQPPTTQATQPPLGISTPSAQLPPQQTPVELPAPATPSAR